MTPVPAWEENLLTAVADLEGTDTELSEMGKLSADVAKKISMIQTDIQELRAIIKVELNRGDES